MENEIQVISSAEALQAISRSEIDMQIATAKQWPRNMHQVVDQVVSLAGLDSDTAAACFYRKPVGKDAHGVEQYAEGESVRFAEILASCWGNMRIATRLVGDDGKRITVQAMCHDLQNNNCVCVESVRPVVGKFGRFSESQVAVTINAAMSIAMRNAIFRVIPKACVKSCLVQVRQIAAKQIADLNTMRAGLLDWYGKRGVNAADLCEYVGVNAVEALTAENCLTLKGLSVAINDGETTIEDAIVNELKQRRAAAQATAEAKTDAEQIAKAMAKNKSK